MARSRSRQHKCSRYNKLAPPLKHLQLKSNRNKLEYSRAWNNSSSWRQQLYQGRSNRGSNSSSRGQQLCQGRANRGSNHNSLM
jgi:hypothetical protein